MLEWKRRIARVVAVLSVALAAGHLVQTKAAQEQARHSLEATPEAIEPVAAGPETTKPRPVTAELLPIPKVPLVVLAPPVMQQPVLPAPAAADPAPKADVSEQAAATTTENVCPVTLDLVAKPVAMIGISLVAACHGNERVVVQQDGLTFTALTNATGGLFLDMPALTTNAQVALVFADGTRTTSQIALPEMAELRRFAIQWQQDDAFLLHGFEGGAGYGTPGDVWAENTRAPSALLPASQGFMTLLGDGAAPAPLMAAVYTYPADAAVRSDIVVEAAVEQATCGRELLGQTLISTGGKVQVQDLAVTMPECDANGGYLVLKNLAPTTNIAAAN
jgi:hypothetical protein